MAMIDPHLFVFHIGVQPDRAIASADSRSCPSSKGNSSQSELLGRSRHPCRNYVVRDAAWKRIIPNDSQIVYDRIGGAGTGDDRLPLQGDALCNV